MKLFKKISYNSPVVLTFVIVSFVSLLLGYATNNWTTMTFFCTYRSGFLDPLAYLRLFGHVLGHANLQHFTSNMLLFLLLGPMLEEKYGSKRLLLMIIVTAFITGVVNNLLFPTALLGASGIVFMMIILSSMVSIKEGTIPLTLIIVVLIYLGQEVVAGIGAKDNISQLTHIMGGVCGGFYGIVFRYKKEA